MKKMKLNYKMKIPQNEKFSKSHSILLVSIDGDRNSYLFSLSWILIGCVFFGGRVKVRDDMAAFKPHDTLFMVLSLFFWGSVHE